MTNMPAHIRISTQFPFPAAVAGAAPITLVKLNGIWTVGFNISGLAIQTPPPSAYATDYLLVWDSVVQAFFRMPLNGLIPLAGFIETVPVTVNFNSANTDTLIPISLPPGYTRYRVNSAIICEASQTLTTATFGLFTAAAGGGNPVIAGGTAITVSTAADNTSNNLQNVGGSATLSIPIATVPSLFFRVGTAQGAPATGVVILFVQPLP